MTRLAEDVNKLRLIAPLRPAADQYALHELKPRCTAPRVPAECPAARPGECSDPCLPSQQ